MELACFAPRRSRAPEPVRSVSANGGTATDRIWAVSVKKIRCDLRSESFIARKPIKSNIVSSHFYLIGPADKATHISFRFIFGNQNDSSNFFSIREMWSKIQSNITCARLDIRISTNRVHVTLHWTALQVAVRLTGQMVAQLGNEQLAQVCKRTRTPQSTSVFRTA